MVFLLISFMSLAFAAEPSGEIMLDFDQPVIGRWDPRKTETTALHQTFGRLDPVATYELLLVKRNSNSGLNAAAWGQRALDQHPGLDLPNQIDNSMAGSYELKYHVAAFRGLPRYLARLLEERGREHDTIVLIDPFLEKDSTPLDAEAVIRASTDVRDLVMNLVDSKLAHVIARHHCFFEMKQLRATPTTAEFSAFDVRACEVDLLHPIVESYDQDCEIAFFPYDLPSSAREGAGHVHLRVGNLTNATMLYVLATHPRLKLTGIE